MDKDNMGKELKQEESHEILDLVARYNANVVSNTENSIYWVTVFVRLLMA